MTIVYVFIALFVFVSVMVARGYRKDKSLELDVVAMPHEPVVDDWNVLTDEEKMAIILKVNYFDAIAKLVFYREEDGTEGVYFMSKKNTQLGWTNSLDKVNITKQQENGNNGKQ